MPQSSYPFAVTRIRALELRMLDGAKFSRLKESSEAEAAKLLAEWGYAQGETIDALIDSQLEQTRSLIWDITPNEQVTALFVLPLDAHNIKLLLKARMLGSNAEELLLSGGNFDTAMLSKAVQDKDYKNLPESFKSAMAKVERQLATKADPRVISALVDKAVFVHIKGVLEKNPEPFACRYFNALVDFTNVRSVIRARALSWNKDQLLQMLLPGGVLTETMLVDSLELPLDALSKKLGTGLNGTVITQALDEYIKKPDTVALERRFDAQLIELVKKGKSDVFTLAPVIGYLLGREAEAKALRVLFASKRAGTEPELPALYV